jgi:hypothetical protein
MWSRPNVAWLLGAVVLAVPAAAVLLATPAAAVTTASRSGPAVVEAAAVQSAPLVTDITTATESKVGLAAPVMTAAMKQADNRKQAAAWRLLRSRMRAMTRLGPDAKCTSAACRAGLPAAKTLAATQQPQQRDYYCGPATASEMLAQLGVKLSQNSAARELGTNNYGGTNWSDASGYPIPRVLNANQAKNQYVAVALPWAPTSKQIKTFEIDLVTDVNSNGGAPLAGNAYEVAGGPHLVGNPVNQTIMHWIDIRGYSAYGAITAYEDSVHNATSIGWGLSVPAYSSLATTTMVDILGARGYAW